MSLFDVIKYPISDPPTKEELTALPLGILREWSKKINWTGSYETLIHSVTDVYMSVVDDPHIEKLRKLIEEYDEPV